MKCSVGIFPCYMLMRLLQGFLMGFSQVCVCVSGFVEWLLKSSLYPFLAQPLSCTPGAVHNTWATALQLAHLGVCHGITWDLWSSSLLQVPEG